MTQYYDSLITITILHDILHSCHNEELLQVSHLTVDNLTHLFHKSSVIVRKSMKREIFKYACGLYSLCCYRLRTTTLYYTLFHIQSSEIYTSAYSGTELQNIGPVHDHRSSSQAQDSGYPICNEPGHDCSTQMPNQLQSEITRCKEI